MHALRIAILFMAAAIALGPVLLAQSWERSKRENPLYGKTYDQFILNGRYLTPPSTVGSETPRLAVLRCRQVRKRRVHARAAAQHSGTKSLKGAWQSQVDMRRPPAAPAPANTPAQHPEPPSGHAACLGRSPPRAAGRPKRIRLGGGVNPDQALLRNAGTCRSNVKGEAQVGDPCRAKSTDLEHRDGSSP